MSVKMTPTAKPVALEINRRSFVTAATASFAALVMPKVSSYGDEPVTGKTKALSPAQIINHALKSNVRIAIINEDQNKAFGSGTVISLPKNSEILLLEGEYAVVSAGHNTLGINNNSKIKVQVFNEYDPKTQSFKEAVTEYEARVIGHINPFGKANSDLSLLAFKPKKALLDSEKLCISDLADAKTLVKSGDIVTLIGCPKGKVPDFQPTRIVYLNDLVKDCPTIVTSGPRIEGHSGGGAILPDGKLIGVCSSTMTLDGKSLELPMEVEIPSNLNLTPEELTKLYQEKSWQVAPAWLKERGRGLFVPASEIHEFLESLVTKQKKVFDKIEAEISTQQYSGITNEMKLIKLEATFKRMAEMLPDARGTEGDFSLTLALYRRHRASK